MTRPQAADTSRRYYIEIFVISFAALLLEISYTRLISFKLFYYYTYLIIGFALLGIGAGAIFVAILAPLRRIELRRLLTAGCLLGAVAVAVSYVVIAVMPLNAFELVRTFKNLEEIVKIGVVCGALFGTFLTIGVMIAALFSANPESINRLYGADLAGAGLGCALVVPLLGLLGPPSCIALAGVTLALVSARLARGHHRGLLYASLTMALTLGVAVPFPEVLPHLVTDASKTVRPSDTSRTFYSEWNPVFRIDVTRPAMSDDDELRTIHHDGLWGSALHRFDGDVASLTQFETDARILPFRTVEPSPRRVLIIGAAGGHEILASLFFGAEAITGVELNPVTVSLLTTVFPDYTGRLHENPRVELINDEGRAFLARDRERYDLIFFVAPDSYSAMNAATAGAFVLSESYLYTSEMIAESLRHLTDDGIICMQFGEYAYDQRPNRTARYVGTARKAFRSLGIDDFARHVMVATTPSYPVQISTILLNRSPFSEEDVARFLTNTEAIEGTSARHAFGRALDDGPVNEIITMDESLLSSWYDAQRYDLSPITDDAPFFWHFARFGTALRELQRPLSIDTEDSVGERLLISMVVVSVLFATFFLILPFVVVRDVWGRLPFKGRTAIYFAALGLGFMLFEISLIQKLTLFLGYPTYTLTVTLMSILVFTGVGSLVTDLYEGQRDRALVGAFGVLVVLTLFYQFGLGLVTAQFLASPLPVRVLLAIVMLAPLGLCLGTFMPLGLATVSALSGHSREYIAWGWAVNGFFSVISSVLTTILSMSFGFQVVLSFGLLVYGVGILALRAVPAPR